jgi:hypothetical protein
MLPQQISFSFKSNKSLGEEKRGEFYLSVKSKKYSLFLKVAVYIFSGNNDLIQRNKGLMVEHQASAIFLSRKDFQVFGAPGRRFQGCLSL